MLRRFGLLVVLSFVPALLVGLPQHAATADPIPAGGDWPWCTSSPYDPYPSTTDDDNLYCVWSIEKDETGTGTDYQPLMAVPYGVGPAGLYEDVWVNSWDSAHVVSWAMNTRTLDGSGNEVADPVNDTDPSWAWRIRINTGSMKPRAVSGVTRNNDYSVAPSSFGGNRLTVTFKPAPIAWRWDFETGPKTCVPNDCGDNTTIAELVSDGFFNGYATDLVGSGLDPREISHRTGMVTGTNAQWPPADLPPDYNPDTNSIDIQLANAHLKAPGVLATGHYEAFLPNAFLIHELQVPDPSTLAGGSFTVSRVGTSTTYSYVVTHEPGGVRIRIPSITFSSPKLRIRPKPSVPGKPRWGSVRRATATKVKLSFWRPYADGGPSIDAYQGRCRRGTAPWKYVKASASPIYIGNLSRRTVDCQVRAHNRIGWGRWNAVKRG